MDSLHQTKSRLILLFLLGILLFLLVFEVIFLGSRFFFENDRVEKGFDQGVAQHLDRITGEMRRNDPLLNESKKTPGKNFGMAVFHLSQSGEIIQQGGALRQLEDEDLDQIRVYMSREISVMSTPDHVGDMWVQKRVHPTHSGEYLLFVNPVGYSLGDMSRDVFRFLMLDLLLILPLWWIGRIFVSRALLPVEQSIAAMRHFVQDAGHELQTPLSIISGNLQILRDFDDRDPLLIESSLETVRSMSQSIYSLLELSSLQSPPRQIERFDIQKVISSILSEYDGEIQSRELTIEQEYASRYIPLEESHFRLLFTNLLSNAIKYNIKKGAISIRNTSSSFAISDTGIGMSVEVRQRIYDRFYRSEHGSDIGGSGIGMAIVDRIIQLYHLQMEIESVVGGGTTITLLHHGG